MMFMTRKTSSELRRQRRAQELTLHALALKAGVTYGQVWRIEQGRQRPTVDTALRLAEALGTTVETLFGEAPSHSSAA